MRTAKDLAGEAAASLTAPSSAFNPAPGQLSVVNVLRTTTIAAALVMRSDSLPTTTDSIGVAAASGAEPERKERVAEIKWSELVPDLRIRPKFGGFGAIFVARWTPPRKIVAVKVLKSAMLMATQSIADFEMHVPEAQRLMRASVGGANVNVVQVRAHARRALAWPTQTRLLFRSFALPRSLVYPCVGLWRRTGACGRLAGRAAPRPCDRGPGRAPPERAQSHGTLCWQRCGQQRR